LLEHRTQPDTAFFVHTEYTNRGAADGGKADNGHVVQEEVFFPGVLPWVEERDDLTRFGVDARQIGALVRVTSVAGQGKVCGSVIPAMLAGNDVLDLERRKREIFLLEQALFTAIASPLTDKFADRCVHQLGGRLARMARAFACKRPIRSIAST
jgi:hypothetical protein